MLMVWTLACALAPNWPAMLIFRYFVGVSASAPIAVVTGQLADIFNDSITRGRAMAWFMVVSIRTCVSFYQKLIHLAISLLSSARY